MCRQFSFFFFFSFFWGPCVDNCLSFFSFLPFPAWGAAFFLLVFGVEFFFFFFPFFLGALCFLSLLPSPEQAVRNRSLCFPVVSFDLVDPVRNHAMNDMLWSSAPSMNMYHNHNKRMCEIDIGNPKYTTFTKLVLVRNFLLPLSLKVFRHEERETQSFYADCFYIVSSQPNQRAAPVAHKFVWPRPALNLDFLVRRQELNSLTFSKSQNPQPTLPGMTSFTPLVPSLPSGVLFRHL